MNEDPELVSDLTDYILNDQVDTEDLENLYIRDFDVSFLESATQQQVCDSELL